MAKELATETCVQIDEGYEEHTIAFKKLKMWITLLDCCKGKSDCCFRFHYKAAYCGNTYEGNTNEDICGNGLWIVNQDPKIEAIVSNWYCGESYVQFHLKIVVHKVGSHTVFDQDLGGKIPDKAQLAEEFQHQLAVFERMAQA